METKFPLNMESAWLDPTDINRPSANSVLAFALSSFDGP
jgi:hypothetical protein